MAATRLFIFAAVALCLVCLFWWTVFGFPDVGDSVFHVDFPLLDGVVMPWVVSWLLRLAMRSAWPLTGPSLAVCGALDQQNIIELGRDSSNK